MIKIIYIRNYKNKKTGDIDYTSRNVAFGLVEQGIAMRADSGLMESPEDKMMKVETRAERRARRKRDTYKVK